MTHRFNPIVGVIKDHTESDDILGRWQKYCEIWFTVNEIENVVKFKETESRIGLSEDEMEPF